MAAQSRFQLLLWRFWRLFIRRNVLFSIPLVLILGAAACLIGWKWHIERLYHGEILASIEQHVFHTSEEYWHVKHHILSSIPLETHKGFKQSTTPSTPDTVVKMVSHSPTWITLLFDLNNNITVDGATLGKNVVDGVELNGIEIRLIPQVRDDSLVEEPICKLHIVNGKVEYPENERCSPLKISHDIKHESHGREHLYVNIFTNDATLVGVKFIIFYHHIEYDSQLKESIESHSNILSQNEKNTLITSDDAIFVYKSSFLPFIHDKSREYYFTIYKCMVPKVLKKWFFFRKVVCEGSELHPETDVVSSFALNSKGDYQRIFNKLLDKKANNKNLYPKYRPRGERNQFVPNSIMDRYAIGLKIVNPYVTLYYFIVIFIALLLSLFWVLVFNRLKLTKNRLDESNRKLSEKNKTLESRENRILQLKKRVVHDIGNNLIVVNRVLKPCKWKKLRSEGIPLSDEDVKNLKETYYDIEYVREVLELHSVDNMRMYVEGETKENEVSNVTTRLKSVVDRCVEIESSKFPNLNGKIRPEYLTDDSRSTEIYGDGRHFRIAFSNLMKNALFHTANSGELPPVILRVEKNNVADEKLADEVFISIWNPVDNDVDLTDTEKWFEDGYTTSASSGVHGKGMGLFHAREIIEGLNGTLKCEEFWQNERRGVNFHIRLPLSPC